MSKPTVHRVSSFTARSTGGFSLIELMVVIAIIAVLATIATNAYQSSITKSRRTLAKACMQQVAQTLERRYTVQLTYAGGTAFPDLACIADLRRFYALEPFESISDTRYRIAARPIGTQLARDTECGVLSLDQVGNRGVTGTAPVDRCW